MRRHKQFAVYILASRMRGTLYVGVTSDLPHRIAQHRDHALPGFTTSYHVSRLVHYEWFETADEAIKRFKFIDAARQAAGGASYGGHLANWLQATTTRYKCLISHAGLVNLETQWATSDTIFSRELNNGGPVWEQGEIWRKQNPIRYAANFKTPMLITVGENDFRVPLNNSLENWSIHQRLRIPSKLLVFPEENHWILRGENNRFFFQEVHAWLNRWLNSSSGAGH